MNEWVYVITVPTDAAPPDDDTRKEMVRAVKEAIQSDDLTPVLVMQGCTVTAVPR